MLSCPQPAMRTGASAVSSSSLFLEARDRLLRCRGNRAEAHSGFRCPVFGEFNWARDYFDVIAAGNDTAALRVVDDAGADETLSFAQLARRSLQVASFLRGAGVAQGDRILIMLPNCTALWEVMLATIRLGAVIIPATTLLEREDLRDRLERGQVSAVITEGGLTPRFEALAGAPVRISTGEPVAGWTPFAHARGARA